MNFSIQNKKTTIVAISLLLLIIFVTATSFFLLKSNFKGKECYQVTEVWKDVRGLAGKRICVNGKAEYSIATTLSLCCPASCDCNETFGEVRLISEEKITYNPRVSIIDYISLDSPTCKGNECQITCSPFNPEGIEYFHLIGTLSVTSRNGEPAWLKLTDLDMQNSRQFVNGKWEPIPTGTFVKPLATATPVPNSCEQLRLDIEKPKE
ncbi:MAG: hypothetical protein IAF02_05530 [Anaerolineae bacterium]|nr:hypothetical protein [Anaerolineae bacterium]